MKRNFGRDMTEEQRALRDFLSRIITRHFGDEGDSPLDSPSAACPEVVPSLSGKSDSERVARPPRGRPSELCAALLGAATLFFAAPVSAEDSAAQKCAHGEIAQAINATDIANLDIVYPAEGSVLRSSEFTALFSMTGDGAAARLDHVHWILSEFDNITAPDLSGVVDISAPREGDHTLVVYMATPEHVPINGKKEVNFKIVTKGTVMLAPSSGALLNTSSVRVNYTAFGDLPDGALLKVQLDGGPEIEDLEADGDVVLDGVSDGSHVVTARITDPVGFQLGEHSSSNFVVQSALSRANAKRALSNVARALKQSDASKRKSSIKKLRPILQLMAAGGRRNPV
ncbi:MAG: hypothetical protein IT290_09680, partial [Deltaproteobacteria bacterium]|nr:hypothetical protein [Deltaproteobacteria bacterium]